MIMSTFLDNSIPARGRCKVTQQPEEVAYIPKTPLWVQGPATAGGGATARKGAGWNELRRRACAFGVAQPEQTPPKPILGVETPSIGGIHAR